MELLIKAGAAAFVAAVIALLIRGKNPELAYALAVVCAVLISISAASVLSDIKELVSELILASGLSASVYAPVVKCVAIAFLTRLICDTCRDAGQSGVSSAVEYLGSAAAVFTVLPLLRSMLSSLGELV